MDNIETDLFGSNETASQVAAGPLMQEQTLDQKLMDYKTKWTEAITELNAKMKTLPKVDELLNEIYAKRQLAVEQYFNMNLMIAQRKRAYNAQYVSMYNNIKLTGINGIRLTSDQQITRQIEACLDGDKMVISMLENHWSFLDATVKTIDQMLYGVREKVEIHKILNGLKF